VVIGAGNVAMDIARTMARLQKQKHGEIDVTLTARKEIEYFKADLEEIKESREEGIKIRDAWAPRECVIEDGKLKGLRSVKVLSSFDAEGNLNPVYDEDNEVLYEADIIFEATGQAAEVALLGEELTEALEWNRGWLKIDDDCRTSEPWLWAAGDCVNGPDVVHAVADGHKAAASIDAWLTAKEGAAS
jgi:glutamate synthase (NADPH/NADH) small chain